MIALPSLHAFAAMALTVAMFVGFARGRMSIEIISLLTIAVIAVGLYFPARRHELHGRARTRI